MTHDAYPTTSEQVAQNDLTELMQILGISIHARPISPHEVFQTEVLPRVRRWREALGRVQVEAVGVGNGNDLFTITGTTYALVWAATDPERPTPTPKRGERL